MLFSNSWSSGRSRVRRFTTTFPSALTLTIISPIGAVFSFAADAFRHFHVELVFSSRCVPRQQEKNQEKQQAHPQAAPSECRDDAYARDHEIHESSRVLQFVFDQNRHSFTRVCRIAMKATPERALKLPPIQRSISATCRGKMHNKSWPEYRSPGPQRC